MRAMLLDAPGLALRAAELPAPEPRAGQVRVRVEACGVCRTDLHVRDGELPDPKLPLILGHEIVGTVVAGSLPVGLRVGIPWLGWTCGSCDQCRRGRENLCPNARFTGYTLDGGYADEAIADGRFCIPLPGEPPAAELAPLLCAGLIGFRALRAAGGATRLGLYGFGAAAHLISQLAVAQGRRVYAFTRPGDVQAQELARSLGCTWAGATGEQPAELDAAIVFAPVGELVPAALALTRPGGTVVCAGIHMSDIPAMPYRLLWGERVLRSVANLTRGDATRFFAAIERHPVHATVTPYRLEDAERALRDLRAGDVHGAAVLTLGT